MKTEFRAPSEAVQNTEEMESLIGELGKSGHTAIQDYRLILLAIDCGMSKLDIAEAQGICIHHLRHKMRLLKKISSKVAALFEEVRITNPTFGVLGKMTERRQFEVAKTMIATGNYSSDFATALLAATRQSDLVKPKKLRGISARQAADMAREMKTLRRDMREVESSYGDDMLNLTIATAYLKRLISNSEVEGYLERHHPEFLEGFREIVASASLEP